MQRFECFPPDQPMTPILKRVESPRDLVPLTLPQLAQLADEVRARLLYDIGRQGGHLGAGLGVVELTLILLQRFSSSEDRVIWDVGHQAYPHKMLTGRCEVLDTIRQWEGLAPFPSRDESSYDAFGVGHAGTAISAALGIALSKRLQGLPGHVCAVLGDGALSCGMSYEALAHAGSVKADLLVVLNDNGMSISPNVGAIAEHLPTAAKSDGDELFSDSHGVATFFETLGFSYHEPVDGHDLGALSDITRMLESIPGPKLLHVVTRKGAGFIPAEEDALGGHSHSAAPSQQVETLPTKATRYQDIFGQWLCDTAALDPRLVGITPAMKEGSGMNQFADQWPDRFFDVAIAEQHALTLAAGMATEGSKPVVAIYSTFLQRAYDQLIHDIALQQLDVTLAVDRAGLVGEDGPTHHGVFDISYLRALPHVILMTPADGQEMRQALTFAYEYVGSVAVRYPRGEASSVECSADSLDPNTPVELGRGRWIRKRQPGDPSIAFVNFGTLLPEILAVADQLGGSVVDMRFVKPMDLGLIRDIAKQHDYLVTIEDNVVAGGAGSAVLEALEVIKAEEPISVQKVKCLGVPDVFVAHGSRQHQLEWVGLSSEQIRNTVVSWLSQA